MDTPRRKRRLSRPLDELPGLFDIVDIADNAIAGDIIKAHESAVKHKSHDAASDIPEIDESRIVADPAIKFLSFGSGSSGNCAYIGTDRCGLLIDAGVDNNYVTNELLRNGIDMASVRGILLTHDHGDHVKFAYSLLRRNKSMALYCTPRTLNGLLRRHSISRRIKDYHHAIYKEFPFVLGDLEITAFEVSHDGTDNVGYFIKCADMVFVVTTDTGYITERADYYMRQANFLMIESNYDLDMLVSGRYPEYLKARIKSDTGHLDNRVTAAYLATVAGHGLSDVFLCHLSHDNNTPQIALKCCSDALNAADISTGPNGLHLSALPRFESSPLHILRIRK